MKPRFTYQPAQLAVLLIALAAVFLPVAFFVYGVKAQTGVFMYPVDDTFIHMELARNLAFHNTWGVNPGEFGSASSSLFYTLLLALLFKIFSAHILIPFLVNCVAGFLLVVVAHRWLVRQGFGPMAQLTILLMAIFLTPLPTVILSGMEHTLQCLFAFLFITRFADWLQDGGREGTKRMPWTVIVFAVLTVMVRYEGLFLVMPAALALLLMRKVKAAFSLGLWTLLPVVLFGVYSMMKGSYFFPNSLLVKSESPQLSVGGMLRYVENILVNKLTIAGKEGITLQATQRLLIILPLAYLVFYRHLKENLSWRILLLLLSVCTLLHLVFAGTGKFYRYEAYLIFCSVVVVSAMLLRYLPALSKSRSYATYALAILAAFFLFFPLLLRTTAALTKAKQACINIYEQQYQMARFLRQHYPSDAFAANDIGAVSFYTDGRVLDLWGLGDNEVARSKKGGYWTSEFLEEMGKKKGVKMAVLYDSWLGASLPKGWKRVGTWKIQNNVVCGDDTATFYATTENEKEGLAQRLRSYEPSLPPGVEVKYE
jgi:hypothetical protein